MLISECGVYLGQEDPVVRSLRLLLRSPGLPDSLRMGGREVRREACHLRRHGSVVRTDVARSGSSTRQCLRRDRSEGCARTVLGMALLIVCITRDCQCMYRNEMLLP